jgi:translation initiation factor 1
MDLRDQLKNLFPDHEEQDFEMPEENSSRKSLWYANLRKKEETVSL